MWSCCFCHLPGPKISSKRLEVINDSKNEAVICLFEANGRLLAQVFDTRNSPMRKIAFAKVWDYSESQMNFLLDHFGKKRSRDLFIRENIYLENVRSLTFKEERFIKQWELKM